MTAAVSIDELPAMRSDDQCPIVNGRYLMKLPGQSKVSSLQRMTNYIKAVEDTYNLNRYDCRMVALGMAHHDDLREMVVATRADDRDALNELCEKAKELAGGNKKSRQGTARHGVSEMIDTGEIGIDMVPEPMRSDVAAYRRALEEASVEILQVEGYVAHDDLLVAGRFDRIVSFGSQPKILDIKTGSLDFIGVATAGQLYGYASAPWRYDPRTETCTPIPDIDRDVALVAHVPTGKGTCTLYWVDLAVGKRAFELAGQVRELRRTRDVFEEWRPGTRLDALIERRVGLAARIQTLAFFEGALAQLAAAWPAGLPTLKHSADHTPEQLSAIDDLITTFESRYQAPFGAPDPNQRKAAS
jgi:hypothetical protein